MNTKMMALALLTLAGTAIAQPAAFTDLGDHTASATFTQNVTLLAANDVQWFRIVLPAVNSGEGYVDIWNTAAAAENITDSMLAMYDNGGNNLAWDDDSGTGLYSQLTFGSTTPSAARPTQTGGLAFNGVDGELAGGEYFVAVQRYGFPYTFDAGFGVSNSYTGADRQTVLNFRIQAPGAPIPPSGSGIVTPASVEPSNQVVFEVTVVAGLNPVSTGINVHGDLTSIGGGANVVFHDDGLNGDAAAGDLVYSYAYVIPGATAGGNYTVPVTVADAEARSTSTSISGNVFNPANLGTLVDNIVTSETVELAANEVKWYKATVLECSAAAIRTLEVSTRNSPAAIDTEIGVYATDGTLMASNDDNPYPYSQLSFGNVGTSGDLAAGVYYFPVSTFNANFVDGFGVTSTGAGGTALLELLQITPTVPTAIGAAVVDGPNGLLTVEVFPAAIPPSTGLAVHADLSSVGGLANQAFFDDGTHGDVTAGDNIFSFATTIPGADGDAYTVSYTATDAQSRSATGDIAFTADVGSMPATAFVPVGAGSLDTISGTFGANDVDMYKIQICDTAGFSAAIAAAADTQLFLFNLDGTGVTFNDDTAGGGSLITNQFITAVGDYYIAATRYNTDPVDAGAQLIWANTPFAVERAPDGPGAASPVDSWTGATGGTATYTITFTGTCFPSAGPVCGPADLGGTGGVAGADGHLDNNDFIVYIDNFFNHLASADIGTTGGVAGSDGAWDNNDFIVFIDQFFAAPASCR